MRCYNDAVALRYELPAGEGSVTLADESTSFQIEDAETAWLQVLEHYKTSHEHNVQPTILADIPEGKLLDLPLTFSWKDGTYAAITEASLRQYAGMALMRSPTSDLPGRLVAKLTPRADGSKVKRPLPMHTPWRVMLLGDKPGALLESNTIYCLNDPIAIGDPSWIKPGKITFSWWNGDVYGGRRSAPILSLEMASKYIDFCARHGIPTHSMTSTEPPTTPWYVQSERNVAPGPDTDSPVLAKGSTFPPCATMPPQKTCGSGHGCTRQPFADVWRKHSPPSKSRAGAV